MCYESDVPPEICAGECRVDADCGDLCRCAEERNECYLDDRPPPPVCDAEQRCEVDEECGEGCRCNGRLCAEPEPPVCDIEQRCETNEQCGEGCRGCDGRLCVAMPEEE